MLARYRLSLCVRLFVRLLVRLAQAGVVSKRLDESSWFWHGGFLSPIPHCVIRTFVVLRLLPSGTLSQTPDLENFATASRSRCQQNSSSSTVEFVDDTYTIIYKSINCNPNFFTSICYGFCGTICFYTPEFGPKFPENSALIFGDSQLSL